MNSQGFVSGVLGVCWVTFGNSTQVRANKFKGCRALCWVCWVYTRARVCTHIFLALRCSHGNRKNLYARTEKPNKPNTLNTDRLKVLILKGFICVGFVLGCGFFVSGSVFQGEGR